MVTPCPLRRYLYTKEQAFVIDVGEDLGVYLTLPQSYIPTKKDGRGRTPTIMFVILKPYY